MKNETDELSMAITELQEKRLKEQGLLRDHLNTTYESLKPVNLIKSTIEKVSASSEIKSTIIGAAVGMGTGFLVKKVLIGNSNNPAKRLIGTLIQLAIANAVSKNSDNLKAKGENLLHRFFDRKIDVKRNIHYNGNGHDLLV